MPTPQPPDERPVDAEATTQAFVQPDDEQLTPQPTSSIDVHIIPPTTESPLNCRHDGRLYHDKDKWLVGDCTNCTCVRGKVTCRTDDDCLARLRPTREPHVDGTDAFAAVPGNYVLRKLIMKIKKNRPLC